MNLLQETIEVLREHTKQPEDVQWVGTNHWYMTWHEFAIAANRDYDEGFGSQEVNAHINVVGDNWWLERHEYDGAEWWEYKSLPSQPTEHDPAGVVIGSW